MKPKDRFARMVEEKHFNDRSDAADAVALLRQEHAWVRKTIKYYRDHILPTNCAYMLDALLKELEQRRK